VKVCTAPRIDSGTYTTGRAPAVVPSNPSGATPMISYDLPFTMID